MTNRFQFDWPSLGLVLEGGSIIDFPKLHLQDKTQAKQFLESYGLNIDDPSVKEEIWRIYFEALSFMRSKLLDKPEKLPQHFLERAPQTEITKLLCDASAPEVEMSSWSCAILRVMHIIHHIDKDVKWEYFQYAREQIFNRFDNIVSTKNNKHFYLGPSSNGIKLLRYLKKERKDRSSMIMKLLSKAQVDLEFLYDRLGLKFVTETRLDALKAVQKLIEYGVISIPHIQPGRSQNNLIPTPEFQKLWEKTHKESSNPDKLEELLALGIDEIARAHQVNSTNPNSSPWYRSIQFTCMQVINAPHSTFRFWNRVKEQLGKMELLERFQKKFPVAVREQESFLYPFEIQVVDKSSYAESIRGRSRHTTYKEKQRKLAQARVLKDLSL